VSGWPHAALRDVADIQLGKMLSPAAKRGVRPLPYLRNANVQWDRFDLADVAEMDFTEAEEAKFRLRQGDVLVVEGGEPGRAAVWDGSIERACYQKAVHRIRPHDDRLDPQFLVYRLWAGGLRGEFTSGETKTTIAHLPLVRLKRVAVPLPPLDEQRRIAARLREQLTMSAAIRLRVENQLETLTRVREEDLASTFARIDAPPIALGAAVSAPGAIADGPFGSHLKTEHYTPNGVRVIRLQNIGSGAFLDHDRAFVTAEHAESLTRHSARQGDVVVAALGDGARPAGRACQVPDIGPAIVKADCFRVRTDGAPVDPGFLVWFLNSPPTQAKIASQMRGATRPRVTLAMLKAVAIPLPPLTEQRQIVARLREQLAETDRAKAALEAQRKAIDALPAALLREVFGASPVGG